MASRRSGRLMEEQVVWIFSPQLTRGLSSTPAPLLNNLFGRSPAGAGGEVGHRV